MFLPIYHDYQLSIAEQESLVSRFNLCCCQPLMSLAAKLKKFHAMILLPLESCPGQHCNVKSKASSPKLCCTLPN